MNGEDTSSQALEHNARHRFHPDRVRFLPSMVAGMIKLIHGSCRFTVSGQEHEASALSHGRSILYACWHFAYPAIIYHFRDRNGMLMVSRSRDGEFMARILKHLGFTCSRGSPGSDKGGGAALRRMMAHTRAGYPAGLIADGSQGPPLVAQKGIILLARYTQAPLVPVSMAAQPCWRFKSWDRTVLARPFSKIALAFGPAVWVGRNVSPDEIEESRIRLEQSINQLTCRCEEML